MEVEVRPLDQIELVVLAALWGASFLFMRATVGEFGPIPLIAIRVLLAALFLLPILIVRGKWPDLKRNLGPSLFMGVLNSAIPFTLIAYSTIYVTAGFASVLNALTPIFAIVIGFLWFRDGFSRLRLFGMLIALTGVFVLVWDKLSFKVGGVASAIAAGVLAALFYAIAANYSRAKLKGVDALVLATGSQLGASIVLVPLAHYWWPSEMPSSSAWLNALALAVACTGLAYILYFRLLENIGAERATTVTFLVPVFGIFWGATLLHEAITFQIVSATTIILAGTVLATNVLKLEKI